jgi:hypothetical protein
MRVVHSVLEWLPEKQRARCVRGMPRKWIEKNFACIAGVAFKDIFYEHTWSFDFLEQNLRPEDVDMWDHISTWYTLTDSFCERNVEWLNFHELVYSQALSRSFYLRHLDRVDWLPSIKDKKNLYRELYAK